MEPLEGLKINPSVTINLSNIVMKHGTWMQIKIPIDSEGHYGTIEIQCPVDGEVVIYKTNGLPETKSFNDYVVPELPF